MTRKPRSLPHAQNGISLIIVMVILVIVTILGVGGAQLALSGERTTRYDRDDTIASQAAEAALRDAELDITVGIRSAQFVNGQNAIFGTGTCGTAAPSPTSNRGLCLPPSPNAKQTWTSVDFTNTSATAPTVAIGDFTQALGVTFQSGTTGVIPAQAPRYIIEVTTDTRAGLNAGTATGPAQNIPANIYRITAVGFGPNPQVQVVMQTAYYKPLP